MQYWIYKSQNASVINMEHSILFIQHGFDLAFTNYVKTINEVFLEIRICFIWMSAKISPNFNHHISTFNVDFVIFTDWFLVRLLCELFISSRANWKIYTSRHIVFYCRGIYTSNPRRYTYYFGDNELIRFESCRMLNITFILNFSS